MAEDTNTTPEGPGIGNTEYEQTYVVDVPPFNPRPDSAEGVGEMLKRTAEFIEDKSFSRAAIITDGSTIIPMMMKPGGEYDMVTPTVFDTFANNPRFRRGTAKLTSLASLIAHVNRFGDGDTVVFADETRDSPSLLAVLDYHRADTLSTEGDNETGETVHGEYRFGLHRSSYAFPLSDEWRAWHASNNTKMGMAEFAIFLENNVLDVAEVEAVPASAARFVEMNGGKARIADWSTLTTLAKSLAIYENAVVREVVNLASGEGEITLAADHDTEIAGVKATVPTMFFVEIPIFREGVRYRLPVRLRYRKSGSGVAFWYELWRSDAAFTDAFHEAVEKVRAETTAQVLYGKPEA